MLGLEIALFILFSGILLWISFRVLLPMRQLVRFTRRVISGERVNAWEIQGADSIREAARALAEISGVLRKARQEQHQADSQLEALLAHCEEGVAVMNKAGVVEKANAAFCRIFQIRENPQGSRLIDLIQIFEINEITRRVTRTGVTDRCELTFESIAADVMKRRTVRLVAVPLQDSSGDPCGCLLVVADYSKLKEMEFTERQMVGSVSHELRTPLSVFKGYLEAIREVEKDGKPETRRMLEVLTRHSNRLNHLVEDLLLLSRLEAGAMDLILEPVVVHKFLARLEEDSRKFLKGELKLEWAVEKDVEIVLMDEYRIEQVFHNLIDNVQRHADSREPIRIGVGRNPEKQEILFFVRDSGRGIPSDKLKNVFTRFFRVDRARSRDKGGSGLGLSIVDEIIRSHGGRTWVESTLGEGTTVWFSIPDKS